jgi:3-hydroxyisobutyrate dehydrogenase
METSMTHIGFIGLGNMGAPMAANLIANGHQLSGFDLSNTAMAKLTQAGGSVADTVAQVTAGADIVITMLPAGDHVRSVYTAERGILSEARPGTLLIDCSTIDVQTARDVAQAAELAGLPMLDAPVSGGVGGAEAGTLTFMVGGSEDAFARAREILQVMGKTVVHCGGVGNGQAAKICNNMILGISMIGVSEAFTLAEKLGLDRQKLFDVSSTASGQCWSLTTYCPVPGPVPTSPANRDYKAGFTAAMMLKDLKLAQGAAHASDTATPLGAEAAALYSMYCNLGHAEMDFSGIIQMLRGQELPE